MNELDIARPLPPPAWGWELPVYLFLGGMAAGLMILDALMRMRGVERSARMRWLAFAPAVLLALGMLALFVDLSGRQRVFQFYLSFRPGSPMSWGAWILLLAYPATLLSALTGLDASQFQRLTRWPGRFRAGRLVRWARELGERHASAVGWANLGVGVGLGVYTGILLSSLGARALWGSALLGPLFLVSGASTGAAFLLLAGARGEERRFVARFDVAAIGVELFLLGLFLFGLMYGTQAARLAGGLLLHGRFAAAFWGLVLLAGLAVPLALALLEHRRRLPPSLVAPSLVLVGGLSLRWILVAAGQA
jgi:protein NrfD